MVAMSVVAKVIARLVAVAPSQVAKSMSQVVELVNRAAVVANRAVAFVNRAVDCTSRAVELLSQVAELQVAVARELAAVAVWLVRALITGVFRSVCLALRTCRSGAACKVFAGLAIFYLRDEAIRTLAFTKV